MSTTRATINPYIFRAYDIRGVAGSDLTPETAEQIGYGFGIFIHDRGGSKVAVGRDNRLTSPGLHDGLVRGLMDSGCNVVEIGLATSPLLYFAAIAWGLDGGVNVTASHLPLEYNGFKLVGKRGAPVSPEEILRIRDAAAAGRPGSGRGRLEERDATPDYLKHFQSLARLRRPLHAVVDTGNGVGGLLTPGVLRGLGCRVTELHCDLDGRFPNHVPNPEIEANVEDLKKRVVEVEADLGLAFDGDGDRLGVVSEKGEKYEADLITMLLARDFLSRHSGASVIVDAKSSMNLIRDIQKHGGVPVLWKSGHSLIKAKMIEDHILLGGELSGHMFVAEDYYPIDDALWAACRLAQVLAASDGPISSHFRDLPRLFATPLIEVHCPDSEKFGIVEKVRKRFEEHYPVNPVDGVRVDFGDGWGLVRASNTNPALSIRCEAASPERLEEIKGLIFGALKEYPAVDLGSLK